MEPINHFDYDSLTYDYSVSSIGNFYVIASQTHLFYANKSSKLDMKKKEIPEDIKTLLWACPVPEINAIFIVGNSNKIKLISFAKDKMLRTIKTFKLKAHKNMHFVKIERIRRIPSKNFFMASADNTSIAKIDYVMDDIKYLKQHVDYVHDLAISPKNLYLSTSTTGLLILSDWTNGHLLHMFTTKLYLNSHIPLNVNLTVFMDFLPERQYFVLGQKKKEFFYFYDGVRRKIFRRFENEYGIWTIQHIPKTSFLVVGTSRRGSSLFFISIDIGVFKNEIDAKYVGLDGQFLMILDSQKKLAIWTFDERICHYSCETCSRPVSEAHCLSCTPGYKLKAKKGEKEGKCLRNCKGKFWSEDKKKCLGKCPSHSYQRLPGQCAECDPHCKTCKGPLDTECKSCTKGFLRALGNCTKKEEKCEAFLSLKDYSGKGCMKCFENCKTCTETGPFKCTACKPYLAFDFFTNTCFSNCYLREYYNYTTGICMRCPPKCISCKESNICSTCEVGKKFIKGRCFDSCPKRTYELPYNGTCHPCIDNACLRCPYDGKCNLCEDGYVLDTTIGNCVLNCTRIGMYLEGDSNCRKCPHGCHSCISEDQCTSCIRGYEAVPSGICEKSKRIFLRILLYVIGCLFSIFIVFLITVYYFNLKKKRGEMVEKKEKKLELRKRERRMLGIAIKGLMKTANDDGKKAINPFQALINKAMEDKAKREKNVGLKSEKKNDKKNESDEKKNINPFTNLLKGFSLKKKNVDFVNIFNLDKKINFEKNSEKGEEEPQITTERRNLQDDHNSRKSTPEKSKSSKKSKMSQILKNSEKLDSPSFPYQSIIIEPPKNPKGPLNIISSTDVPKENQTRFKKSSKEKFQNLEKMEESKILNRVTNMSEIKNFFESQNDDDEEEEEKFSMEDVGFDPGFEGGGELGFKKLILEQKSVIQKKGKVRFS